MKLKEAISVPANVALGGKGRERLGCCSQMKRIFQVLEEGNTPFLPMCLDK